MTPAEHIFRLEQNGVTILTVRAPDYDTAWAEITRYAEQHGQNGPCKVMDGDGKTVAEFGVSP